MSRLGWRLLGAVLGVIVVALVMRACGMHTAIPF